MPKNTFINPLKKLLLSTLLLILSTPSYGGKSNSAPYLFLISSYTYSPIAPLHQMLNDLEGPPVKAGDFAFSTNYYQIGTRIHNWTFSVFQRYDFYAQFNSDTVKFMHAARNKVKVGKGKTFDIQLNGAHLRASGLKNTYQFNLTNTINIGISLSYLYASDLYQGDVTGSLVTTENSVEGNLNLDYDYSHDIFLKRGSSGLTGKGYSTDITIDWKPISQLSVHLQGLDLFNRIYWDKQFHTTADATTNTVSFDSNGLIDARPVLEWLEDEVSFTQELPRQLKLNASFALTEQWNIHGEIYQFDVHNFYRLGLSYNLRSTSRVSGVFDITTRSVSLSYHGNIGYLSIVADSLHKSHTHSFGLNTGVSWSF